MNISGMLHVGSMCYGNMGDWLGVTGGLSQAVAWLQYGLATLLPMVFTPGIDLHACKLL